MKNIAFIPARGGSKRLPGKNVKKFLGKALIEYTIEYALECGFFNKIILSSDCEEILSFGKKYNIDLIKRPAHLASDMATTADAAYHSYEYLQHQNIDFDSFVTLQITNPFRTKGMLAEGFELFLKHPDHTVISISRNRHKMGTIDKGFSFTPTNYTTGQRSQDLNSLYYENGLFYITPRSTIASGEIFGTKMKGVITDEIFSMVDIDTKLDFELGEIIYEKYRHLIDY